MDYDEKSATAEVELKDGVRAALTFAVADGAVKLVGLAVQLDDPGRGEITTDVLRELPTIRREAVEALRDATWWLGFAFDRATVAAYVDALRWRAGRGDRFYAFWAALYAEKVAGGSPHPAKELAREHPTYTAKAITDLVYQARERGLITPTRRGRAGGQLTDRAIRLLATSDGR